MLDIADELAQVMLLLVPLLQKKIIRIMMGAHPRTSCRKIYKKLEILTDPSQYIYIYIYIYIYRVSQKECARLWESVPYVKLYRYIRKHLYAKLIMEIMAREV